MKGGEAMSGAFDRTRNFVKEDTSNRLVFGTQHRQVTIDGFKQDVTITIGFLLTAKKRVVRFDEVENVHLDCLEESYPRGEHQMGMRRRWSIFLALKSGEALLLANGSTEHPEGTPRASNDQPQWEQLAARISALMGKTLVRGPSVPGAVHTFVEEIDQIIQRRLDQLDIRSPSVRMSSQADGSLAITVDNKVYREPQAIEDATIRDIIQAAIDEWQAGNS
jgi:hypothetical protein